jgi:hypothetical protein
MPGGIACMNRAMLSASAGSAAWAAICSCHRSMNLLASAARSGWSGSRSLFMAAHHSGQADVKKAVAGFCCIAV